MKNLFETERLPVALNLSRQVYHLLVDAEGSIFHANEAFNNRFARTSLSLFADCIHPNDVELFEEALYKALRHSDQSFQVLLRLEQQGGDYAHTSFELLGRTDSNGRVIMVQLLGVDVTAQVQQFDQQQLIQQINAYLNGIQIGLVMVDRKGAITRTNRNFSELSGLHFNELKGRYLPDVLPATFDALALLFREPGRMETDFVTEIRVSEQRWYEIMVYANPYGATIIFREITDTVSVKKALELSQADLQKREEWFRHLLANSVDLVLVTDAEMNINYVTSSASKMLGYEPEEILGLNAVSFIHPQDLEAAIAAFRKELEGVENVRSVDMRLRCKNGNWKWVEGMGNNKLNDGIINGMIIYLNDIEERKKAEEELVQNEKKYKAVVNSSYNGIIISDFPGKIVSVNPSLCAMFGYTPEEFLSKRVQDYLDFSDPYILESMQQLHSTGSFRGEVHAVHKSGRRFWVELHASFLYREGEMDYFSTVVRDIDNERAAQLELEKREELLAAVARATTLLVTATDWMSSVGNSMESIGTCLHVERVYVFETHTDVATGQFLHSQRFEWNSGQAEPQIDNPDLQNMPHELVQEIFDPLFQNRVYAALVTDVQDAMLREALVAQDIRSMLLLPVFLGGKYWGMVGFDDCKEARIWKSYEIETLRLYAATFGGVIERRKSEQLISESQRRYKLLFDENPAPLLSVRAGDLQIRNVNSAAILHYGYTREEFLQLRLTDICTLCNNMTEEMRQQLGQTKGEQRVQSRHIRKDGSGIDVEITMQELQLEDNESQLLLLVNDITESLQLQREKDLIDSITDQLLQPKLLEQNLHDAIRLMRRHLQWDAAELWSPNYDNSLIRLSVFETELADAAIKEFEEESRISTYTVEQYGSRPAFKSGVIVWKSDIAADDNLIRKQTALRAGFVSYMSIPLKSKGQVLGLLYFFSRSNRAFDERHNRLLTFFGNNLASEIDKRRKETELNIFYSLGTDGMIICSFDGRYKKVNPSFCSITEYSEAELVEMYFLDIVLEEDRAGSVAEYERLLKSGQSGVFENRIRTKSGHIKWLEWTSGYDEKENIIVSSSRDITEKKLAETQLAAASAVLQQALEENRKILDYSQDIIATFTRDGILSNINPACEELLGYSPEDMIGEHLSMFVHAADMDQLLNLMVQLGTNDTTIKNYELEFRHQQGRVVQMEWTIHWSGIEQLAFAVARDITQQKKAEQALQASEKRFRMFMDNNPASAWIIDEAGTLLYINKQSNPLHIVDDTFVGQNLYDHIDPRYLEAFRQNNQQVLAENKPVEAIEVVPMKDGSEIIQLVYKFPVEYDGQKRLIGGIGIDITAQKQVEAQLQLSEQRFRSFMDKNPAGAWINDEHGTFVFVNREYNAITRNTRPIKEGDHLSDLYSDKITKGALLTDRQVIETGEPIELEGWFPRGDGTTGYFLVYKFPVPAADGRRLVGGILLDVTDRKLVEDEVARIKHAIDSATDAVLIFDKNLNCVYTNQGFEALFGLNARQLNQPGRSGFVLLGKSRDRQLFASLKKTGTWQGDLTMKNKEGEDIYISLRANVILNEQHEVSSYVGVFTNITERVMANRQIRETAQRLTNIMESISEGMLLVRNNWELEYMNPAAEHITGVMAGTVTGKKLITALPQLKGSNIHKLLREAMRKKEGIHFEEYFAPLEMWLDVSCYYLNDGLTIYFRNVTDRRRSQMQLALEREAFASMTTAGRDFKKIATRVLEGIEAIYPGSLCSILMLQRDGETVEHLSAPSLPAAYCNAIDGAKIGPETGSCGTAMFTGQMVITEDIATDYKWERLRDFTLGFGLRASWSHPLINSQGKVVGSFAIYYKQVKAPSENEIMFVQRVANFLTLIFENIQAEEGLQRSNERFELATRATDEAIWDWDMVDNTIQWTHAFNTLFGIAEGQNDNSVQAWESRLHPDDADRVMQSIQKAMRNRKARNWQAEYRFRRSDGTYADVLDKCFLVRNQQNKVVRMVGSMQDISERKRLQEQLLEQQISKQKQMAQVAVEAQEKERAEIGTELHDNVNQLLTTTKLYLELAKSNENMREDLINRSATNITEIIQEIRQLSRSLVPHSITDLGMVAAVNDLIETLQLVNVIDIRFEYSGELEQALTPSLKVTVFRIIQEQLNNIIKHAYANGVLIQLKNRGNYVQLVVKDDGAGFDMKTVKRGIGISNIMSRANMFDGKAAIISKPGKGCKLSVQIPLQ